MAPGRSDRSPIGVGISPGGLWNTHTWNNIVLARGKEVTAYNESRNAFVKEGEWRHLRFTDYDLYTAPPRYTLGQDRLTLDEMKAQGFERHSQVVERASDVFVEDKTWQLKDPWQKAGRYGDALGPDNIARILDTTRYGPQGRPKTPPGQPSAPRRTVQPPFTHAGHHLRAQGLCT